MPRPRRGTQVIRIEYVPTGGTRCFRACFADMRGTWDRGTTPTRALGRLMRTCPDRFNTAKAREALPQTFPHEPPCAIPDHVEDKQLGETAEIHPDLFDLKIELVEPETWPAAARRAAGLPVK